MLTLFIQIVSNRVLLLSPHGISKEMQSEIVYIIEDKVILILG